MIGLIGYGALGVQVRAFLQSTVQDFLLFDDNLPKDPNHYLFNDFDSSISSTDFLITLGYNHLEAKAKIHLDLEKRGARFHKFHHPSCYINPNATLSPGSIIYPMCNLDANVLIGKSVLLNNSVVISHDSHIGDFSFLSPGVTVCGNVKIGKRCFIGAGAILTNGVKIGDDCIIGAGSLITKDLPSNTYGLGNPFQSKKNPLNLN